MQASFPNRFRLRLIGDQRKRRWLYLSFFAALWFAGVGILIGISSDQDLRFIGFVLWLFVCIPLTIYLFRVPCTVEVSDHWFSIETLRSAPMMPRKTQTCLWGDMYGYQYKGLYEHEQSQFQPDIQKAGFVSLFLKNGDVFHFYGREAESFYGYVKRRFPDKVQFPY